MVNTNIEFINQLRNKMETELTQLLVETHEELNPVSRLNYSNLDSDGAVTDIMVDTDNAKISMHLFKVQELEAALERIQLGGFGLCKGCGCEIAENRLLAYPTAERCVECQNQFEKTTLGEVNSKI